MTILSNLSKSHSGIGRKGGGDKTPSYTFVTAPFSPIRILILLVLLSLAVRFPLLIMIAGNATDLPDAINYFNRALGVYESVLDLIHGRMPSLEHQAQAYSSHWPPLQTMVLSIGMFIFGKSMFAARLTMVFISAFTVPLVYLVTKKLSDRPAALWAAALFAVYPTLVHYSLGTRSETTYIFLLFVAVYLALLLVERMEQDGLTARISIALGCMLGLITLTRSVGVALIPAVALWLMWRARAIQRSTKPVFFMLAAVTITLLPWEVVVTAVEGRLVFISSSAYQAYEKDTDKDRTSSTDETLVASQEKGYANGGETSVTQLPAWRVARTLMLPELEVPKTSNLIPWSIPPDMLLTDPIQFIKYGFQHWWLLWGMDMQSTRTLLIASYPPMDQFVVSVALLSVFIMQLVIMALVVVGVLSRGVGFRSGSLLLIFVMAGMLLHFIIGPESKYSVPMQALLLPLAGQGLISLGTFRQTIGWSRAVLGVVIIALIWFSFVTSTQSGFGAGLLDNWGAGVRAPSSYYAALARRLEPWIEGPLPVGDRFLFRVVDERYPAEVHISTVGGDYGFEPDHSQVVIWKPGDKSIISVLASSRVAAEPLRLRISTTNGSVIEQEHNLIVGNEIWQQWKPVGSMGIEYMWVGGPFLQIWALKVMSLTNEKPAPY